MGNEHTIGYFIFLEVDGKLFHNYAEIFSIFNGYFSDVVDMEIIPKLSSCKSQNSEPLLNVNLSQNIKFKCSIFSENDVK